MIVKCDECGKFYWQQETDTFVVEVQSEYTDGREHFDVPRSPSFFHCANCGSVQPWDIVQKNAGNHGLGILKIFLLPKVVPASSRALLDSVDNKHLASHEQQIRLEVWRLENDPIRDKRDVDKPPPSQRPSWWFENLDRLSHFELDLVTRAEIYRERGDFSTACTILDGIADTDVKAETIFTLACETNPHVRLVGNGRLAD